MLHQVMAKLEMNLLVINFLMHGYKLVRHLVIDFSKKPLALKDHVMSLQIRALTLDDYVVHDHIGITHLPYLRGGLG
jgi:succinate dehydrogenase/fumarate reductase cytochrome b subunit